MGEKAPFQYETIKKTLRSIGPGFIIASVVLGPGSITVASSIGSEHGYAFLWVVVLAALSMLTYTSMSARFGVMHDKSFLQVITDTYGHWFAVLIGFSAFFSAISFQFGNNLGIGIGMQGLTGIDERLWPLIFTPLAIILNFWARDLYKVLERIMMSLVIIMILSFFINMVMAKPNGLAIARGFIPHTFSFHQLDVVAALVATTFSLNGAFYQSYLVQIKGWKPKNLKGSLKDSYIGIIMLAFISMTIIITSAAALHPARIKVHSAADMALQLDALFGRFAKYIFSAGLCAAAFSSLMVNSVMGGGLLADGLGMGPSMNEKAPKIFTSIILLTGMLIAVFFRGDIIYTLIIAQAFSMLAVPLIAIGMFIILNNRKVMGSFRNNTIQNILAVFGFLLVSVMVYYLYSRIISFLGSM